MSDVTVVVKTKGADTAAKEIKNVGDAAEKSHGPVGKLGGALGDVSKVAGGFLVAEGIQKLGGFLTGAAKAAAEDEQSTARLSATIKSLGGDFQAQNALVQAAIKHGQDLAFTDDDVRDSFDKLAQATGNTEEALSRQAIAMDLARGANIPLADASKLLGKVTDENLQVFKRLGITLPDVASEADVLAAVQAKFAGQSTAYAQSTAGQFEQTQIRMSELKESIGAQLLPVMTKIGEVLLTDVIPKLEQFAGWWATNVQPKIEAFFAWAQPRFEAFVAYVGVQFAKFQEFYASDIQPAFDNIVAGVTVVVEQFRAHWEQIEPFVRPLFIMIETAMNTLQATIKIILDIIAGDWSGAWQGIKDLVGGIFDGIEELADTFKDQIVVIFGLIKTGAIDFVTNALTEWPQAIGSAFIGILSTLGANVDMVVDKFTDIDWLQIGKDIVKGIWNGISAMWDSFVGYLQGLIDGLPWIVKKALGIASPSKVFYKIGEDIVEGFNAGIQAGMPGVVTYWSDVLGGWVNELFQIPARAAAGAWQTISSGGDTAAHPGWNVLTNPADNPTGFGAPPKGFASWRAYWDTIGMGGPAVPGAAGSGLAQVMAYIGGGQYAMQDFHPYSTDRFGSYYQGYRDPNAISTAGYYDLINSITAANHQAATINLVVDGNVLATVVNKQNALGY